jgi:hypothetical protein
MGRDQGSGKVEICPVRTAGRIGPGLRWQAARGGVTRARLETNSAIRHFPGPCKWRRQVAAFMSPSEAWRAGLMGPAVCPLLALSANYRIDAISQIDNNDGSTPGQQALVYTDAGRSLAHVKLDRRAQAWPPKSLWSEPMAASPEPAPGRSSGCAVCSARCQARPRPFGRQTS